MRDILAALLRARGYTHDDQTDPYDLYWRSDDTGARPMLQCVAYEISRETGHPVEGWDHYDVAVAHARRGVLTDA